jgi:lysophospholipase L1-like esterase
VFVDSRAAFKGHLACGPAEWINGFSPRSWNESFHPNQSGYQAFASLLRRAL